MLNLFVAYDLYRPGQDYSKVEEAVKKQGTACKLLNTTWYLKTSLTMEQARDAIWTVMDPNDKLLVIDAKNACGQNMPKDCWAVITAQWNK